MHSVLKWVCNNLLNGSLECFWCSTAELGLMQHRLLGGWAAYLHPTKCVHIWQPCVLQVHDHNSQGVLMHRLLLSGTT